MILNRYFDNCSLSMDKVSFSISIIGNTSKKELFEALTHLKFRKCKFDCRIKNKKMKYNRMRKYIVENSVIVFFYKRRNDTRFLPDLWCTYQNPSKPVLTLLDSLCNSLGFTTRLSQIELAIDFLYTRKLERFFNKHLCLKYNRGQPTVVGDTDKSYYSGHKSRCAKTIIVYPKIIERIKHMRLELILNRRVIKNLGLDLTMEGINNIDFSRFVCFKKFNHEKLFGHQKWLSRYKLFEMKPVSRSICLRLLRDVELPKNGMLLISHLKKKGYLRPQRFFEDMPKTNRKLYKLLKGKRFLK